MPHYRIERTELHTRVWILEAADEDTALDEYAEAEEAENKSYHAGEPDVRITTLDPYHCKACGAIEYGDDCDDMTCDCGACDWTPIKEIQQ